MLRFAVLATVLVITLTLGAVVPAATAPIKLTATVGPSFSITLKQGKKTVSKLKAGRYTITVSDKSRNHNFHLNGPGVNKSTTVSQVVTTTWRLKFKKGSYTFVCDPHRGSMKGSFKVT